MRLTYFAVKAAKGREKLYKLTDGRGLYLLVLPSGRRYWRMDYRFNGRGKTLAFGVWPDVDLALARERLDKARKLLARGIDPGEEKKREKMLASLAAANTFRAVAEEWLVKVEKEGLAPSTLKKNRWMLDCAYPAIGNRPIAEIQPVELLTLLRTFERRGKYETAHRLKSICSQVFRYAVATVRAPRDISADLRGALITPRTTHRPALTTPAEVGALLRALYGYEGRSTTVAALRLLPHVFVRPGELRHAEWSEIDFENAVWTIPGQKMKMRRAHKIPLSRQALEIITSLANDANLGRFLFPSIRTFRRPMSQNTINAALRRLGYAKDEMTGHGFRATASTLLNEMGHWNPDAIERQLAHVDTNSVRRAYMRGQYWEERVHMMQFWSDYLDRLRNEVPRARPESRPLLPRQGLLPAPTDRPEPTGSQGTSENRPSPYVAEADASPAIENRPSGVVIPFPGHGGGAN